MKGSRRIVVTNNKLHYNLVLDRKITVIKGKSAAGKTTLVGLIALWIQLRGDSGVTCRFDADSIIILRNETKWQDLLVTTKNCIFLADEDFYYIDDPEFGKLVDHSENYFLFINRSGRLENMTYAIQSIVEMKSEKRGEVIYTSVYQKYIDTETSVKPDLLITEDKCSGYEMMKLISKFDVIAGEGKDNVVNKAREAVKGYSSVAIFVDGAAFGSCIGAYGSLLDRLTIIAPESFEYVLLHLDFLRRHCEEELSHTAEFCDFNAEIISYERYYTDLLTRILKEQFGVSYTKSKLPALFKNEQVYEQVKSFLLDIDFT